MLNMRQPSGSGVDMALVEDMLAIEARLDASGRTVADLCREAGLARSTWDRWRRGETEPNMRSWRSVTDAAARLMSPPAPSAASGDSAEAAA
jgi:transcriptional regulator with XRE-family HTH domain